MSTARKGLLALFAQLLAPMIQRAVAHSQVSRNVTHRFAATLDELHRFQFELPRIGFLLLGHLALLCFSSIFHVWLLHQTGARSGEHFSPALFSARHSVRFTSSIVILRTL